MEKILKYILVAAIGASALSIGVHWILVLIGTGAYGALMGCKEATK